MRLKKNPPPLIPTTQRGLHFMIISELSIKMIAWCRQIYLSDYLQFFRCGCRV